MMRPYVLINVAATVDGKIDTVARRGAAISSEADRARVDALRASVDAVMVGARTLLDEDPRLTVRSGELRASRLGRGVAENPVKVSLLSRPALLRGDSRFLSAGPARIILFTPPGVLEEEVAPLRAGGVEVYAGGGCQDTPPAPGARGVDLVWALGRLGELGIGRLLVEGGGSLNFELLRLGLVDEVIVFVAPLVFGGAAAPTLADGLGLARDAAIALRRVDVEAWPDGGVLLRYMVEPR